MNKNQKLINYLDQWEVGGNPSEIPELALNILKSKSEITDNKILQKQFLELTGDSKFLSALPGRQERYDWADSACQAIAGSEYHLRDMFARSVSKTPKRSLFEDYSDPLTQELLYKKGEEVLRKFIIIR